MGVSKNQKTALTRQNFTRSKIPKLCSRISWVVTLIRESESFNNRIVCHRTARFLKLYDPFLGLSWRFCSEGQELPSSWLCSEPECHMPIKTLLCANHWKNCFILDRNIILVLPPLYYSQFYLSFQICSTVKDWFSTRLLVLTTDYKNVFTQSGNKGSLFFTLPQWAPSG